MCKTLSHECLNVMFPGLAVLFDLTVVAQEFDHYPFQTDIKYSPGSPDISAWRYFS